jgi:hypothetical protein
LNGGKLSRIEQTGSPSQGRPARPIPDHGANPARALFSLLDASRPKSARPAGAKKSQLTDVAPPPAADPALGLPPRPFARQRAPATKKDMAMNFARQTIALASDAVVLTLASPFIAGWFVIRAIKRWRGGDA